MAARSASDPAPGAGARLGPAAGAAPEAAAWLALGALAFATLGAWAGARAGAREGTREGAAALAGAGAGTPTEETHCEALLRGAISFGLGPDTWGQGSGKERQMKIWIFFHA